MCSNLDGFLEDVIAATMVLLLSQAEVTDGKWERSNEATGLEIIFL